MTITLDGVTYADRAEYDRRMIDTAAEFTVVQFIGRGRYVHLGTYTSKKSALARRDDLKQEVPTARLMVCAINRTREREVSILVTE